MSRTPAIVLDGLDFPECPRWHDDRLFFSDQHARRVCAMDTDGKLEEIVDVIGQPSGLGWLPDGSMLVVSMHDHRVLRYAGGALVEHADLSQLATSQCNDMVVTAGQLKLREGTPVTINAAPGPASAAVPTVRNEADSSASLSARS